VEFDFGPRADDDEGPAPDFSGQAPLGLCPKCGKQVFETANAYVCERAVGEGRSCDFRSGRTILQRVIDRAQMTKLLETGKTDLLQFVSARTRRPFSAYLVKQPDGKVGFEFEAKAPGRKGARGARIAPLRVLGAHPRDRQPVELHAGRYGPYVKHGSTNATLPDRDAVDSLSLDEAIALVDEKSGRGAGATTRRSVGTRTSRESASPRDVPGKTRSARGSVNAAATAGVRKPGVARKTAATTGKGVAAKKRATPRPPAKAAATQRGGVKRAGKVAATKPAAATRRRAAVARTRKT
jgi:hypothetical protein